MKRILFACCITILCSCQFTQQQNAEHLVKTYLNTTLNDPASYESVSFGKLYKMKDTVILLNGKPDSILRHGKYEIEHTYRAKNAFGGVITQSDWFQIDSAFTEAQCCFVGQESK